MKEFGGKVMIGVVVAIIVGGLGYFLNYMLGNETGNAWIDASESKIENRIMELIQSDIASSDPLIDALIADYFSSNEVVVIVVGEGGTTFGGESIRKYLKKVAMVGRDTIDKIEIISCERDRSRKITKLKVREIFKN